MFDRKALKSRAKFVLARSFLMSVIACAIMSFVTGGMMSYGIQKLQSADLAEMSGIRIAVIYAVIGVMFLASIGISIFVAAPLDVGLKHFMLRAADMDVNLENLMYPFRSNYKNIVWVTFVKNLYIGLWMILGFVPLFVGLWKFGLADKLTQLIPEVQSGSVSSAMSLAAISGTIIILTLIFMVPAFIKGLQYSMVEYILSENPDMKRSQVIGKSKEMMVGNKWAYVKLMFSFLGWYLLANSTCCIGNLILRPYIEATYAQMYLEITGQGKDYTGYDYRDSFGRFENM